MSIDQGLLDEAAKLESDIEAKLAALDGVRPAPEAPTTEWHDPRIDAIADKVANIESVVNDIKFQQDMAEVETELAEAEAADTPKEGIIMQSTTDMIKDNATQAAKVSGANVVNKKLVAVARKQLKELGVSPEILDTQIGRDLATNFVPIALYALASNPAVAGMVPHADKVAKVASFASQGAMNESMDRLIRAIVPFLNEIATVADEFDLEDSEGLKQVG